MNGEPVSGRSSRCLPSTQISRAADTESTTTNMRHALVNALRIGLPAIIIACCGAFARDGGDRPRGIFVLDSIAGATTNVVIGGFTNSYSLRDANVRVLPFVTGYVLRASWETMEPQKEIYDFAIIDHIIARIQPSGQWLSLIITPYEPAYIAATTGVTTWVDIDRDDLPRARPVPWDPYLLQQRALFLQALARHTVAGTPLAVHPVFAVVNPYLPGGHSGIRDPNITNLYKLPGYSRSNFTAAVQHELRLLTGLFSNQYVQIGFWKYQDYQPGNEPWEELRQALLAEFNGVTRPRVGFWMENWAASRPAPAAEPVTGYPVTAFGAPLYLSRTNTFIGFQALTSWKRPFTGPDKVTNAEPADGIAYAVNTYSALYFEVYQPDIDATNYWPGLQAWHAILFGIPEPAGVLLIAALLAGIRHRRCGSDASLLGGHK